MAYESRAWRAIPRPTMDCPVCGKRARMTIDHIVALEHGGTDDPDNLQYMCGPCNTAKGNRETKRDRRPRW